MILTLKLESVVNLCADKLECWLAERTDNAPLAHSRLELH